MITPEERKNLKQIIGSKHISKISKFFFENNIMNRENEFYSSVFISRVFNGKVSNPTIEEGIQAFLRDLKKKKDEKAALIKDLKGKSNG